eukprot:TRINITY_DN246_c1_g1_i6.p1 TRINITY_DN246_c1_g1~~TRINITY_DN246_c1_g1_i6.p1  ORF type:complete len:1035 (-),score=261.45 TRINITY_DN246_c1_g1_i6:1110-4214(-)
MAIRESADSLGAQSITTGRTYRIRERQRACQRTERRQATPEQLTKVMTVNVNGMRKNRHGEAFNFIMLGRLVAEQKPDVLAVTETWLEPDMDMQFEGYESYHSMREAKEDGTVNGGGVCIFVRNEWDFKVGRCHTVERYPDFVGVQGTTSSGRKLTFWCYYGVQESVVAAEKKDVVFSILGDKLKKLREADYEIILLGDFNAHMGDAAADGPLSPWINPTGRKRNDNGKRMLDVMDQLSLKCMNGRSEGQHVTFQALQGVGSVLDLIIASPEIAYECEAVIIPEYNFGGHKPVYALIHTGGQRRLERPAAKPRAWNKHLLWAENNFEKLPGMTERPEKDVETTAAETTETKRQKVSNRDIFAEELSTRMERISQIVEQAMDRTNVTEEEFEDIWKQWADEVVTGAENSIGRKKAGKNAKEWWTAELDALHKARKETVRKASVIGRWTDELWTMYNEQSVELKAAVKAEKKNMWRKLNEKIESLKGSKPREFWKTIKRLEGSVSKSSDLFVEVGAEETTSTAEEKVEVLKRHYEALGNEPPPAEDVDDVHNDAVEEELKKMSQQRAIGSVFNFHVGSVDEALKQRKLDKAAGPDGIPIEFLRFGGDQMTQTLTDLFNLCVKCRRTPHAFKCYNIFSLWKRKGDARDARNYRGISLLNVVGKVYVRALANSISTQAEPHLHDEQAGFRTQRETVDQLIILKDQVDRVVKGGKNRAKEHQLNTLFVDFKAAYDRVWRDGLWWKMHKMGINAVQIELMQEIYSVVEARTMEGSAQSEKFNIDIGVRQGCVASPILFAIYVNDLIGDLKELHNTEECFTRVNNFGRKFNSLMFADDLAMTAMGDDGSQAQLNVLDRWCKKWKMTCHPTKTKVMRYNLNPGAGRELIYRGTVIADVDEYEYLGMIFEAGGDWSKEMKVHMKLLLNPLEKAANESERMSKSSIAHVKKVAGDLQPEPYVTRNTAHEARTLCRVRTGQLPVGRKLAQEKGEPQGPCELCGDEGGETVQHFLLECTEVNRDALGEEEKTMEWCAGSLDGKKIT